MNTLLHPQGPEGEAVYWRRRAVIMFVLIAIIAVISLIAGRVRRGGGSTGAAGSETAAAGQTPVTEVRTPGASVVTGDGQCALDDVTLDVVVPDGTAAGQAVDMTVELGASAGAPCSLDLGEHVLSVTVASGTDEYWSTTTCTDAAPGGQIAIMGADPVPLVVTWPGTRVGQGCADTGDAAAAGSYLVTAGIGGTYASSRFTLS
ncbi:hypothetical protein [uncultured Propionibacterium sp.]|uniref:hypothetical protein n=1 Tax=uncultured Propionibacterium sp. TaxID=218066 RepID=UPI00293173F5|nr:hypothetical protein [uncultured Propionibacterium sp.]